MRNDLRPGMPGTTAGVARPNGRDMLASPAAALRWFGSLQSGSPLPPAPRGPIATPARTLAHAQELVTALHKATQGQSAAVVQKLLSKMADDNVMPADLARMLVKAGADKQEIFKALSPLCLPGAGQAALLQQLATVLEIKVPDVATAPDMPPPTVSDKVAPSTIASDLPLAQTVAQALKNAPDHEVPGLVSQMQAMDAAARTAFAKGLAAQGVALDKLALYLSAFQTPDALRALLSDFLPGQSSAAKDAFFADIAARAEAANQLPAALDEKSVARDQQSFGEALQTRLALPKNAKADDPAVQSWLKAQTQYNADIAGLAVYLQKQAPDSPVFREGMARLRTMIGFFDQLDKRAKAIGVRGKSKEIEALLAGAEGKSKDTDANALAVRLRMNGVSPAELELYMISGELPPSSALKKVLEKFNDSGDTPETGIVRDMYKLRAAFLEASGDKDGAKAARAQALRTPAQAVMNKQGYGERALHHATKLTGAAKIRQEKLADDSFADVDTRVSEHVARHGGMNAGKPMQGFTMALALPNAQGKTPADDPLRKLGGRANQMRMSLRHTQATDSKDANGAPLGVPLQLRRGNVDGADAYADRALQFDPKLADDTDFMFERSSITRERRGYRKQVIDKQVIDQRGDKATGEDIRSAELGDRDYVNDGVRLSDQSSKVVELADTDLASKLPAPVRAQRQAQLVAAKADVITTATEFAPLLGEESAATHAFDLNHDKLGREEDLNSSLILRQNELDKEAQAIKDNPPNPIKKDELDAYAERIKQYTLANLSFGSDLSAHSARLAALQAAEDGDPKSGTFGVSAIQDEARARATTLRQSWQAVHGADATMPTSAAMWAHATDVVSTASADLAGAPAQLRHASEAADAHFEASHGRFEQVVIADAVSVRELAVMRGQDAAEARHAGIADGSQMFDTGAKRWAAERGGHWSDAVNTFVNHDVDRSFALNAKGQLTHDVALVGDHATRYHVIVMGKEVDPASLPTADEATLSGVIILNDHEFAQYMVGHAKANDAYRAGEASATTIKAADAQIADARAQVAISFAAGQTHVQAAELARRDFRTAMPHERDPAKRVAAQATFERMTDSTIKATADVAVAGMSAQVTPAPGMITPTEMLVQAQAVTLELSAGPGISDRGDMYVADMALVAGAAASGYAKIKGGQGYFAWSIPGERGAASLHGDGKALLALALSSSQFVASRVAVRKLEKQPLDSTEIAGEANAAKLAQWVGDQAPPKMHAFANAYHDKVVRDGEALTTHVADYEAQLRKRTKGGVGAFLNLSTGNELRAQLTAFDNMKVDASVSAHDDMRDGFLGSADGMDWFAAQSADGGELVGDFMRDTAIEGGAKTTQGQALIADTAAAFIASAHPELTQGSSAYNQALSEASAKLTEVAYAASSDLEISQVRVAGSSTSFDKLAASWSKPDSQSPSVYHVLESNAYSAFATQSDYHSSYIESGPISWTNKVVTLAPMIIASILLPELIGLFLESGAAAAGVALAAETAETTATAVEAVTLAQRATSLATSVAEAAAGMAFQKGVHNIAVAAGADEDGLFVASLDAFSGGFNLNLKASIMQGRTLMAVEEAERVAQGLSKDLAFGERFVRSMGELTHHFAMGGAFMAVPEVAGLWMSPENASLVGDVANIFAPAVIGQFALRGKPISSPKEMATRVSVDIETASALAPQKIARVREALAGVPAEMSVAQAEQALTATLGSADAKVAVDWLALARVEGHVPEPILDAASNPQKLRDAVDAHFAEVERELSTSIGPDRAKAVVETAKKELAARAMTKVYEAALAYPDKAAKMRERFRKMGVELPPIPGEPQVGVEDGVRVGRATARARLADPKAELATEVNAFSRLAGGDRTEMRKGGLVLHEGVAGVPAGTILDRITIDNKGIAHAEVAGMAGAEVNLSRGRATQTIVFPALELIEQASQIVPRGLVFLDRAKMQTGEIIDSREGMFEVQYRDREGRAVGEARFISAAALVASDPAIRVGDTERSLFTEPIRQQAEAKVAQQSAAPKRQSDSSIADDPSHRSQARDAEATQGGKIRGPQIDEDTNPGGPRGKQRVGENIQGRGVEPRVAFADILPAASVHTQEAAAARQFVDQFAPGGLLGERLAGSGVLADGVSGPSPSTVRGLSRAFDSKWASIDRESAHNVDHLSTVCEGALRDARAKHSGPLSQPEVDRIVLETVLTDAIGKGRMPDALADMPVAPMVAADGTIITNGKELWDAAIKNDPSFAKQAPMLAVMIHGVYSAEISDAIVTAAGGDKALAQQVNEAKLGHHASGFVMALFARAGVTPDFATMAARGEISAAAAPKLQKLWESSIALSKAYRGTLDGMHRPTEAFPGGQPALTPAQRDTYFREASTLRAALDTLRDGHEDILTQLVSDDTQQFTDVGMGKWLSMYGGDFFTAKEATNGTLIEAIYARAVQPYFEENIARGSGEEFVTGTAEVARRMGMTYVESTDAMGSHFRSAEPGEPAHEALAHRIAADPALAEAYVAARGLAIEPRGLSALAADAPEVRADLVAWLRTERPKNPAELQRLAQSPDAPQAPGLFHDGPPASQPPPATFPSSEGDKAVTVRSEPLMMNRYRDGKVETVYAVGQIEVGGKPTYVAWDPLSKGYVAVRSGPGEFLAQFHGASPVGVSEGMQRDYNAKRDALPPAEQQRLGAAIDRTRSPQEQYVLMKEFALNGTVAGIEKLQAQVRGIVDGFHLSEDAVLQLTTADGMMQFFQNTCALGAVMEARVNASPAQALELARDMIDARAKNDQKALFAKYGAQVELRPEDTSGSTGGPRVVFANKVGLSGADAVKIMNAQVAPLVHADNGFAFTALSGTKTDRAAFVKTFKDNLLQEGTSTPEGVLFVGRMRGGVDHAMVVIRAEVDPHTHEAVFFIRDPQDGKTYTRSEAQLLSPHADDMRGFAPRGIVTRAERGLVAPESTRFDASPALGLAFKQAYGRGPEARAFLETLAGIADPALAAEAVKVASRTGDGKTLVFLAEAAKASPRQLEIALALAVEYGAVDKIPQAKRDYAEMSTRALSDVPAHALAGAARFELERQWALGDDREPVVERIAEWSRSTNPDRQRVADITLTRLGQETDPTKIGRMVAEMDAAVAWLPQARVDAESGDPAVARPAELALRLNASRDTVVTRYNDVVMRAGGVERATDVDVETTYAQFEVTVSHDPKKQAQLLARIEADARANPDAKPVILLTDGITPTKKAQLQGLGIHVVETVAEAVQQHGKLRDLQQHKAETSVRLRGSAEDVLLGPADRGDGQLLPTGGVSNASPRIVALFRELPRGSVNLESFADARPARGAGAEGQTFAGDAQMRDLRSLLSRLDRAGFGDAVSEVLSRETDPQARGKILGRLAYAKTFGDARAILVSHIGAEVAPTRTTGGRIRGGEAVQAGTVEALRSQHDAATAQLQKAQNDLQALHTQLSAVDRQWHAAPREQRAALSEQRLGLERQVREKSAAFAKQLKDLNVLGQAVTDLEDASIRGRMPITPNMPRGGPADVVLAGLNREKPAVAIALAKELNADPTLAHFLGHESDPARIRFYTDAFATGPYAAEMARTILEAYPELSMEHLDRTVYDFVLSAGRDEAHTPHSGFSAMELVEFSRQWREGTPVRREFLLALGQIPDRAFASELLRGTRFADDATLHRVWSESAKSVDAGRRALAQMNGPPAQAPRIDLIANGRAIADGAAFVDRSRLGGDYASMSAETLERMGVLPQFKFTVDGVAYNVSRPFSLGQGRLGVVAMIEVNGRTEAHIFYRSNSQASWRVTDASRNDRHYGKGFHENDTQLPIEANAVLTRLGNHEVTQLRDPASLQAPESAHEQATLGDRVFYGLVDRNIVGDANQYNTEVYGQRIARAQEPLSRADAQLNTPNGHSVADLKTAHLPSPEKLPNFTSELDHYQYVNPEYAKINGGDGTLTARVFLSHDGTVRYLFVEDNQGRASMASAEMTRAEVSEFGNRRKSYAVPGMDAPLMEYNVQMPIKYGGNAAPPHYLRNWNYVREQPIMRVFYEGLGRPMPPPLGGRQS